MATTEYVSLHDQRVAIIADALTSHSDLSADTARELAGHALDALDHIPEKVR
jgi:uncharacterized protein DUF6307